MDMLVVAADSVLGDALKRAGEVAGGATAVGATIGLIVGAVAVDLGRLREAADSGKPRKHVNHWEFAGRGGALGGVFGITVFILERL